MPGRLDGLTLLITLGTTLALVCLLVAADHLILSEVPLPIVDRTGWFSETEAWCRTPPEKQSPGERQRSRFISLANHEDPTKSASLELCLARMRVGAEGSWLKLPDPGDYLEYAGRPVDMTEYWEGWRAWDCDKICAMESAMESARVARPEGGKIVLFPACSLGGPNDLWMVEVDPDGVVGPSYFLGVSMHTTGRLVGEMFRMSAQLDGHTLEIRRLPIDPPAESASSAKSGNRSSCSGGACLIELNKSIDTRPIRLSLDRIKCDSDRDGLTDIMERRLRTNAFRKDTDLDGIVDSVDRAPNALRGEPQSDREQIVYDIFRQFFYFEDREPRPESLAVMVSPVALEWQGRPGATITLDEREDKLFQEESGRNGVAHIRIEPWHPMVRNDRPMFTPENSDEEVYTVEIYHGGLWAVWYEVLVARRGRNWVIKAMEMSAIS